MTFHCLCHCQLNVVAQVEAGKTVEVGPFLHLNGSTSCQSISTKLTSCSSEYFSTHPAQSINVSSIPRRNPRLRWKRGSVAAGWLLCASTVINRGVNYYTSDDRASRPGRRPHECAMWLRDALRVPLAGSAQSGHLLQSAIRSPAPLLLKYANGVQIALSRHAFRLSHRSQHFSRF